MLGITVTVTFFVLLGVHSWQVFSKTHEGGLHHHSHLEAAILTRYPRNVRPHREPRQSNANETRCKYYIAMLDFPPYVMNTSTTLKNGPVYEKIEYYVETKCFMRENDDPVPCYLESIFCNSSDELIKMIQNGIVDFAFPIQANDKEKLNDNSNVTIIRAFVSLGCSLIVNTKQCEEESREQLLTSITSQWPIFACIILLSGISGMVIWILEFRGSQADFSPSFTVGSHEGFWWAVVSLTTVGYGDKTPKSFLGRMFGVLWILVGAIMLSLFTALFTNAMQAALDGTKCKDIDGKEVGLLTKNTEAHRVAEEHGAKIVEFSTLEEMKKNLTEGTIRRVLLDRNIAYHLMDKYGLKRNRQIRLIRNIDFPLEYNLAHVKKEEDDVQRMKLTYCGLELESHSNEMIKLAQDTVKEQVLTAELQTADLSDEMEGLFSTESQMTSFILFCLLGTFLALIVIGILWELYTKCSLKIHGKKNGLSSSVLAEKKSNIPLNSRTSIVQQFTDVEERLKELASDIQKMKEEFVNAVAGQERGKISQNNWQRDERMDKKPSVFSVFNGKSRAEKTSRL